MNNIDNQIVISTDINSNILTASTNHSSSQDVSSDAVDIKIRNLGLLSPISSALHLIKGEETLPAASPSLSISEQRLQKRKKIARKILPANRTPSLLDISGLDDQEMVKHHAFVRVNLLFLMFAAYWNKQPPTTLRSQMMIGGAAIQAGVSTISERQAAHSHIASGLKANTSEMFQQSIFEHGITPETQQFLQAKKFPARAIAKLERNSIHREKISNIFAKYWPSGSIIEGTAVDALINATVCSLPRDVNLKCDKSVEKLRTSILPLLNDCYMGKYRPEEACERSIEMIRHRLSKGIQELDAQIDLINHFDAINSECIQIEKKAKNGTIQDTDYGLYRENLIQLYTIARQLSNSREVVAGCNLACFKFYKVAFRNIQFLKKAHHPKKAILELWNVMPKSRKDQSLSSHNTWVRAQGDKMQRSLNQELKTRVQLRAYYQWELEGTQSFDYSLYFGKEIEGTQRRSPLSDEELLTETYQMIASVIFP